MCLSYFSYHQTELRTVNSEGARQMQGISGAQAHIVCGWSCTYSHISLYLQSCYGLNGSTKVICWALTPWYSKVGSSNLLWGVKTPKALAFWTHWCHVRELAARGLFLLGFPPLSHKDGAFLSFECGIKVPSQKRCALLAKNQTSFVLELPHSIETENWVSTIYK